MTNREARHIPRFLASLIMGFVIIILNSTLFSWWALGPLRLDPLVVLVVSAGFFLPFWAGSALVFFLGYLNDVVSGGVVGLDIFALQAVLTVCVLAQQRLAIDSWPLQMGGVWLMSLLMQVVQLAGIMLVHRSLVTDYNIAWILLVQSLLTALTAPLFFWILEAMVKAVGSLLPARRRLD